MWICLYSLGSPIKTKYIENTLIIPSPPSPLLGGAQKALFENRVSQPVYEEKINTFNRVSFGRALFNTDGATVRLFPFILVGLMLQLSVSLQKKI